MGLSASWIGVLVRFPSTTTTSTSQAAYLQTVETESEDRNTNGVRGLHLQTTIKVQLRNGAEECADAVESTERR